MRKMYEIKGKNINIHTLIDFLGLQSEVYLTPIENIYGVKITTTDGRVVEIGLNDTGKIIAIRSQDHPVGVTGCNLQDSLEYDSSSELTKKATKFIELAKKLRNLVDDEHVSWELKYDILFSNLKEDIKKTGFKVDYYDPDTSYEDDVRAFNDAVQRLVPEIRRLRRWL